mgnify:CR=1 FL=1
MAVIGLGQESQGVSDTVSSGRVDESQPVPATPSHPVQLRALRIRRQRILKSVILLVVLAFLLVPLMAMMLFTVRQPLSGQWGIDAWKAIFLSLIHI